MSVLRELAKGMVMDTAQTLCKDASFIPSESLDWKPMDHGKSANEILSECAKTNYLFAAVMQGRQPDEAAVPADFEALKGYVVASAEAICAVIDGLSEEDLGRDLQMPWGATMPMTSAIILPASHMGYHDGQINYIQLLLGDTKFHWAEG